MFKFISPRAAALLMGGLLAAIANSHSADSLPPADVYLFGGQSNSAGFGMGKETLPPELQTTFQKVQIWTPGANERKGLLLPLQPGVNSNHPNAMWAAESPLALLLEKDPKQAGPIFFIKSAIGGAPLQPRENHKDWHPEKGGYYGGFRDGMLRAVEHIKTAGYEPRFRAFVWVQGEAEIGEGPAVAAQYSVWLKDLINAVRRDTGVPDLNVVVVR
ncbi:MAG TPA: sialate O-acetylesterase, partial [Chthoniobacterales bacterium]